MLLTRPVLDGIVAGEVDLVFRLWKRSTVRPGGRLRTAVGELAIHEVDVVEPAEISEAEAHRAGYADVAALRAALAPRPALRETPLGRAEIAEMLARLQAMEGRAQEPWVFATLDVIARWPGRRAPELAELLGRDTLPWKAQVRRLKELGLTESLPVGYRLSPRGQQVHAAARRRHRGNPADRTSV